MRYLSRALLGLAVAGMFSTGAKAQEVVGNNQGDFNEFMELCHISADLFDNSFTYTLLDEEDLN